MSNEAWVYKDVNIYILAIRHKNTFMAAYTLYKYRILPN